MTTDPRSAAEEGRRALGARLRQIRKPAGLSGRALAAASGIHFTWISKIEHGHVAPTVTHVRNWCDACGAADRADDLIAELLTIEAAYVEWKSRVKQGMRNSGDAGYSALWESTGLGFTPTPTAGSGCSTSPRSTSNFPRPS
ncbi:helix-turn-helix domain-containing protein [Pilimelia anulata]|uniref:helix-turn-helix domain-containing protein n=1 Tax=Pilimelia anulata TaxID=53371 RepID=UPI001E47969B|nr:helix-turn-helix transcriptional regulator [Pilimelia anulata]